jgi:phage-related protein
MSWTVEFANRAAEAEVAALPADMNARFLHIGDMIRSFGLTSVREPYVKHVSGKLWEMRDGIARSIYVAASGQRVVVLRTFTKKTQETPRREMEIAFARMKEMKE